MPFVEKGDVRLNYRFDGPEKAPVILLSNSLGTNLSMWDPQATVLCEKFCVLRYDMRGHGLSTVTPGPYTIEQLGRDVIALLDALKIESAYFCGLSMSGMIGMWLGANAANRMKGLVLCNTASKIGNAEGWNARIKDVKERGMAAIATTVVLALVQRRFHQEIPRGGGSHAANVAASATRRLCGVLCGGPGRGLQAGAAARDRANARDYRSARSGNHARGSASCG